MVGPAFKHRYLDRAGTSTSVRTITRGGKISFAHHGITGGIINNIRYGSRFGGSLRLPGAGLRLPGAGLRLPGASNASGGIIGNCSGRMETIGGPTETAKAASHATILKRINSAVIGGRVKRQRMLRQLC